MIRPPTQTATRTTALRSRRWSSLDPIRSILIAVWLLSLAANVSAIEVVVQPLSGEPVQGQLRELSADRAVVESAAGLQTFESVDLLAITTGAPKSDARSELTVELRDGSTLLAESYTVQDRTATIKVAGGQEVSAGTRAIRSVRFKMPSAKLDGPWTEIASRKVTGDVIVIRKSAESIDELEGILHEITADAVRFELDDNTVPVERDRLEGIVYFHPEGRKLPKPACVVSDLHGSVWRLQSLKLDGEQVVATSVAGVAIRLPVGEIQKFDFSAGNLIYLSDLEPASVQWTSYVGSAVVEKRLARLYAPRRDRSLDGGKLTLAAGSGMGSRQEFTKGLAIHSRTELVYRLDDDFVRFRAVAGIDERVRENGHVELVIWADERELLRQAIAGTMEPVEIDLDISGAKRLKILVDFGQGLDIADHLDLCDARITK